MKFATLATATALAMILTGGTVAFAPVAAVTATSETGVTETITDPTVSYRISELVAAYDQAEKKFDAGQVSAETLSSKEGEAFVAAVTPSLEGNPAVSSGIETGLAALRQALTTSGASSTPGVESDSSEVALTVTSGATIVFPAKVDAAPRLAGGADPFPYVQLTQAEQQAMVTGASATLIAAICALLGPETAGVGCGVGAAVIATIVGIMVANGVCPNSREMRIYPLAGTTGFSCQ